MLAAVAQTISGLVTDNKVISTNGFDVDEKELEETVQTQSVKTNKSSSISIDFVEEEEEEFDEGLFAKEFELGLENVRQLGKVHQEVLIDTICDNFYDLNGIEASVDDISSIFARLKGVFAEEAVQEAEEGKDDNPNDSDYDENALGDLYQVQKDEAEDYSSSSEEEEK